MRPATSGVLRIIPADTDEHLKEISLLFHEYAASLGVDLSFQNFAQEVASLPGDYAPPDGRLFLAATVISPEPSHGSGSHTASRFGGCIGVRKIDDEICEMKRLYVRPEARGHGAGRALAEAAITAARQIGYRRLRLDTLPQMSEAQKLYRALGFYEIPPYRYNPVAGTRYFELAL